MVEDSGQKAAASDVCEPELMDAEDPLFILYTSGSTGKPKGVFHTTAGYLLGASITHKYVFDYHEGDIYWCTADVGWVTGHSYIVYGPLANGAITLMFEGVPTYPDASRFWQVIDKHQVNIFYTAPTAIRALMSAGDDPVKSTSRASLRLLGLILPSEGISHRFESCRVRQIFKQYQYFSRGLTAELFRVSAGPRYTIHQPTPSQPQPLMQAVIGSLESA